MADKPFKGVIRLDIRDSTPDRGPFTPVKAPEDAPNILFVLFDDTGLAAWSPFGGAINMPTLEKMADNGLMYTQWHTTALCSPTRCMLLTGRNHHLNGMASITEATSDSPASTPACRKCATVGQILQDGGWSTFWVGKNHNVPETDVSPGATRSMAVAEGFRPLLRLHGRRDQSVVSRSGRGQSSNGSALPAGRRISSLRRIWPIRR